MMEEQSLNEILREHDKIVGEGLSTDGTDHQKFLNSPYSAIAKKCGLQHSRGNIFIHTESGKEFIRTNLGFQPIEVFNKGLQLTQFNSLYNELFDKYANAQAKIEEFKRITDQTKMLKEQISALRTELGQCRISRTASEKAKADYKNKTELYLATIGKMQSRIKSLEDSLEKLTLSRYDDTNSIQNASISEVIAIQDLLREGNLKKQEQINRISELTCTIDKQAAENKTLAHEVKRLKEINQSLLLEKNESKGPDLTQIIKYYTKLLNEVTLSNEKLKNEIALLSGKG